MALKLKIMMLEAKLENLEKNMWEALDILSGRLDHLEDKLAMIEEALK